MSQDTRKDPRAKIVSLNVRYKSATVDEFIDNHASDVSKGGIFIKTSTPFPQGTLLKFEIRLAGDQSVIAGVGRVVWKRDTPSAAAADRPAGMGVKFIKLDDASRAVIDKLTSSRADAGSAFTSELEGEAPTGENKAMTATAALKQTQVGLGPSHSKPPSAKPTITGLGAQSGPPRAGKSTIVGMAAPPQPSTPPKKEEPKPATPGAMGVPTATGSTGGGFFPAGSGSQADMPPPAERTVMKQAAELLEEALKEAGGSMDEVGTNPLFEKSKAPPAVAAGAPIHEEPAKALETKTSDAPKAEHADTVSLPKPITSSPFLASDRGRPMSDRPAPVNAKSYVTEEKKPNLLPFVAVAVLLVGGGGFFAYKQGVFGGGAPNTTPPVPTPTMTASAPPIDSTAAITPFDAGVVAMVAQADAAAAIKDAGAAVATATATATAKPPATHAPRPPKPPPTATDEGETPAPTSTAAPTATDTSTTPTPAPTTTSTAAPTSTSTKSTKPGDDNPY